MSDYQKTQWNSGGAPGISADNLNKIEAGVDTAHDELHTHEAATNVHGATSDATASRLIVRDAQGRAKVAAPSASDDIARKAEADAVQANLNSHATLTTAHGSTSAATANTIMQRDAQGRAKVTAPSAADDIARKAEVDARVAKAGDTMTGTLVAGHSAIVPGAGSRGSAKIEASPQDFAAGSGPRHLNLYPTDIVDGHGLGVSSGSTEYYSNGQHVWYHRPNRATINDPYTSTELMTLTNSALTFKGNTVWHTGNDGAGSGLDADTVDGYQPTSAGGTEANRLAVTNASGRVGDSNKVAGKAASEIVAAEQLCTLGTVPREAASSPSARVWTVKGSFAYYVDETGAFKKIELATGTETTLVALPTGIEPLSLAEAGADKIMLLGRQTASPYHHVAYLYSIAGNSFGLAIDLLSGVTLYASQGQAVAAWDGANYVYVLLDYRTASSTYYCRVVRITLDTLAVTALWTSSSASSPLPVCGIGIIGGKLWVVYDYSGSPNWVNMNLDGTSPELISQISSAQMRLAWCANPTRAMWWGWSSDYAGQGGYGRTKIHDGSKTWCLLFPYITGAYAGLVLYAGDIYILDSPRPFPQDSSPSQWSVFKFKDPLAA